MKIGIIPIVDFAFAKVFMTPENKIALIAFLNAILILRHRIVDVTLLNPFNYRDFADDKLAVLDVKAIDSKGRIFNIEMQLSIHTGLKKRIVFYGCETYTDQLRDGSDYSALRPVYAICIINDKMWTKSPKVHHRFVFIDKESGRTLKDTLEIHTLELGWYNLSEGDLAKASQADRWLFWLLHAQDYEPDRLRELFPEMEFQVATNTLIEISEKTEDKAMYDARQKAIRDHQWAINSSKKEGEAIGKAIGKAIGEVIGEARGEARAIRTLQSILRVPISSDEELSTKSLKELQTMTESLQQQILNRQT